MKGIFFVSCVLFALIYQSTALKCYTCNNKADPDRCEDINSDLKPALTECNSDKLQQCVSVNFKSANPDLNGFARGCADTDSTVTDYCDFVKEQQGAENVLECVTCKTEGCNSNKFTSKRDGDNGASSLEVMLTVIPLLIACILLTR